MLLDLELSVKRSPTAIERRQKNLIMIYAKLYLYLYQIFQTSEKSEKKETSNKIWKLRNG